MSKWKKGYDAGYIDGILTTLKVLLGILLLGAYIACVLAITHAALTGGSTP